MRTIKENVNDYYGGEDEFFNEAFVSVINTAPTKRQIVEHTCDIDKHDLFGNIDGVIEYLKSLKTQGYTIVEERWSGYENNYFVGIKKEEETDEEYYKRLGEMVTEYSEEIAKREEEEMKKKKRIKELEEELRKIRNSL